MAYLVHVLNDDGNFELIDNDFLELYPDLNPDELVELSDEQYQDFCAKDNGKTQFVDGEFVFAEVELDEQAMINQYRNELMKHIDDTAAQIAAHWTRFESEYKEREAAAEAFKAANFEGEPNIYVTSYAISARIDNKTATLRILEQAVGLRHLQGQLAAQRMRKYLLDQVDLTIEQLQELHDDIINNMHQLAEAAQ